MGAAVHPRGPCTAISAMLDSKGRAFVLIQVLYSAMFMLTDCLRLDAMVSGTLRGFVNG